MRKLLTVLMLLAVPSAYGSQFIKQSTATQVDLKFVDSTNGVDAEIALDVTTFDCNLIKHADSGMATTALTITASGGSNDSAHLADGIYSLELTATDTNTIGRLDLYCQCAGAAPFEAHYTVVASEVYDAQTTDIASIDDNWEYQTSSIGTSGGIGLQLKTNADVPTSQYSLVRNRTTIATLSTQVSFTLTDGSPDNDAYNGWLIYVQDQALSTQIAAGIVGDYTGSTKTVTLLNDPAVFTMAVGDIVYLVPDRSLKALIDNRYLTVSSAGHAGINLDDVEGALGTAQFDAGFLTSALIASDAITASQMATDMGAEIATAVWAATLSEMSQGIPSATPTGNNAIMALYMALRNRLDVDATTKKIYNDAGTVIFKKTLSDNGVTFTETEAVSGP
jgi:hypothetical protein